MSKATVGELWAEWGRSVRELERRPPRDPPPWPPDPHPRLRATLRCVVDAQRAFERPPGDHREWSGDACKEAVWGWYTDRLTRPRPPGTPRLHRILTRHETQALCPVLRKDFHRYLYDARATTETMRLRERIRKLLLHPPPEWPPLRRLAGPFLNEDVWSFGDLDAPRPGPGRLHRIARAIDPDRLGLRQVRKPGGRNHVPIDTPGLALLTRELLRHGPVAFRDLWGTICGRVQLPDPRAEERVEVPTAPHDFEDLPPGRTDPPPGPPEQVIALDHLATAKQVFRHMTLDERLDVAEFLCSEGNAAQTARARGVSAARYLRRVGRLRNRILEFEPDPDAAAQVLGGVVRLIDLAFPCEELPG